MSHQWQAYDHHDTLTFKLTDYQERELISAWQHKESFDDVIAEAQQAQGVAQ